MKTLGPETLSDIRSARRDGDSPTAIAKRIGITFNQAKEICDIADTEDAYFPIEETVDKFNSLDEMKEGVKSLIGKTLVQYEEKVKAGVVMSPTDLKSMMAIYMDMDKVARLDTGKPTDIFDIELLSMKEIYSKLQSENFDKFAKTPIPLAITDEVIELEKIETDSDVQILE